MTTKPKAKKFRVRRSSPGSEHTHDRVPRAEPVAEDHTGVETTRDGVITTAREMNASQDMDEIRNEGLTSRQLRMARRVATKHGLKPTSDFDAVRQLRAKGIDPFQRANIIELLTNDKTAANTAAPKGEMPKISKIQLPQTIPADQQTLPSKDISPADRRAKEIMKIQHDIGRRRRRKLSLLLTRLAAFVLFPTLISGYYYFAVATPMYTTKTEFLILTADGSGLSAARSLLGGSPFATAQDSIATQSYLQSKDAMLRLDRDVGFRAHFSQSWIDPIQRLKPDASNEAAYKLFKKYIKLGYDPTEGVIRMELSTAEPEVSAAYSEKLIEYAEERVDELSRKKRQDAVTIAISGLEEAKMQRREAQRRLVELQENSILDPIGEIASIRGLISTVELRLLEKELDLSIQLSNARPNKVKVDALRGEITVFQAELRRQNARLTQANDGRASLAQLSSQIQIAQADLATADLVLQASLENKRLSEAEANKQVRYLTVSVRPVASEDPSFPRSFENTILAFLIFSGIYLMLSLTASILREQVSS